jgi:hypothetical protein
LSKDLVRVSLRNCWLNQKSALSPRERAGVRVLKSIIYPLSLRERVRVRGAIRLFAF